MTIELKGQYTSCKIFNDEVEEEAIRQVYNVLNHPAFENQKLRLMPDIHGGKGCVIGFTSSLGSKIICNLIGVDIGCGAICINLGSKILINPAEVDAYIRKEIPFGCRIRTKTASRDIMDKSYSQIKNKTFPDKSGQFLQLIEKVCEETQQDTQYVINSLGTMGGNNHYIELNIDDEGNHYLNIHTGSRNFGLKIANWHQKIASKLNPFGELSYLEGDTAEAYFKHMKLATQYAALNREIIAQYILEFLKIRKPLERIESVHNYIDFEVGVIRKGAISAKAGEKVVIPFNMKDGILLGVGKGNEDWNYSAPHGAGRIMGRGAAKKILCIEEYKASMDGIWTSCVSQETIDESPMAYKDCKMIESLLEPTVEVIKKLKPIYNFKASENKC